ncbi:MAG: hypothetical protein E7Z77_07535 [Methanobrevibacter sp.]|uniref:hypothetical protein n=1 Tax=Methanobrevibacter sp. TaxID=66852 RepID=UPI0025E8FA61|nr:hypothetical protein [Methanobrevibacter sp.]MBE6509247.1 hypothetical protein [Methanobrevibacter sp.]
MSEKYIRNNKNSYNIVKSSKIYAKITDLEDAIFIRDLLIKTDWDLNQIPKSIRKDDSHLVLAVIDEKVHLLARFNVAPDDETIERLTKNKIRNPNNSRYGLNITKVFDTYVIKKQIAGDDYIFGYYDSLSDAQFVRNFLLDHNWNVNEFSEIELDDETETYKVIRVIDDNVYVIDSYDSKDDVNLSESYEKFLAEISKHKFGLANHPHLDLLKDSIPDLEMQFNVKTKDDVWSFEGASSPLDDIIFNLTPFQQSVYDAIGSSTSLDEIKRSLIRYKSKNFDKKILRNIDDLIEMNLIEKMDDEHYKKID